MIEIVPLSILLQNSRNEKYIQTSLTGRNLHHLTEFVTRRLQEVIQAGICRREWGNRDASKDPISREAGDLF